MNTKFIYLCIRYPNIDSYNPWFKEYSQINCPDIYFAKIRLTEKIIFLHVWLTKVPNIQNTRSRTIKHVDSHDLTKLNIFAQAVFFTWSQNWSAPKFFRQVIYWKSEDETVITSIPEEYPPGPDSHDKAWHPPASHAGVVRRGTLAGKARTHYKVGNHCHCTSYYHSPSGPGAGRWRC